MLRNITHDLMCYITHDLISYITHDLKSNKESRFWYWGHKTKKAPCPSGDLTTNISSFNTATLDLICYITHDMLCYITHDPICYITHDMLYNTRSDVLYNT